MSFRALYRYYRFIGMSVPDAMYYAFKLRAKP